ARILHTRDAGNSCDHHAGEKLHGGHVAMIEGGGRRGEDLEHSKCAPVMPQWGYEDGANSEAAAAGEINTWIALSVMAEHDLPAAYALCGNAGIGLQTHAKIRGGAAG